MNASTWYRRLLCAAGVALGLCLAGPGWADEKKDAGKGQDDKRVIIIQLDPNKVSPDVLKKLLEMSRSTGKDENKRPAQRDDDKKPAAKKDEGKKPNIVQVDLNKLSPDLARRLTAELAQSKEGKKSDKKDDEGDKKKKDRKKDDEDDGKKGGQKKDD